MDLVVFQYLYEGFDARHINMEFLGDDQAIIRAGVFRSLVFHCKILNVKCFSHNFRQDNGVFLTTLDKTMVFFSQL